MKEVHRTYKLWQQSMNIVGDVVIPSRICWNCDDSKEYLKGVAYPFYCPICKHTYINGECA